MPQGAPNGHLDDDDDEHFFDPALQHERTSLAWERTAIAVMVSGMLLARYAAEDTYAAVAAVGLLQTLIGAAVLVWSGRRYDDLHGQLFSGARAPDGASASPIATRLAGARSGGGRGANVSQATALRWIGLTTIVFAGAALALAITLTVSRSG